MNTNLRTGSIIIRASKRWIAALAVVVLAPWLVLLTLNSQRSDNHDSSGHLIRKSQKHQGRLLAKGPWGELKATRIVIEPPAESLVGYLSYPKPTWLFKGYSKNDYVQLLHSAGLSDAQLAEIEGAARWNANGEGCAVSPSDTFVLNLSPEARGVLYAALSLFEENLFQHEPFRFRADQSAEWFAKSGVPEPTLELVRRLIYRRGNTLLFSDPHLVLPTVSSEIEKVNLLRTLSRQSTLTMQLHVSPDTDIDSLLSYWAPRENSAKDIKPLLESVVQLPEGFDIDITHFLPRFARKRIYTYPRSDGDKGEMSFDCHWNSMNFWNDPPDDRFASVPYVIHSLETDYATVLDGFRFGDIVLFMKSDTQAIHSAVYIADNIVFTKNGPSPHSPWILMDMETLTSHYETNTDLTIRGYRKKSAANGNTPGAP